MRTKLNSEETSSNPTCRIWKTHQAKISFTCRGSFCRKLHTSTRTHFLRAFTYLYALYATCTCFSTTRTSPEQSFARVIFHPCVAW